VKRLLKCIFLVTWSTGSKIEEVYFYILKIFFTAPWLCNISSIPGCALIMDQRFERTGCRMTYIAISEKNSQELEDKPLFLDRMHIANI
jgi:hypothetical protein